MPKRFTATEKWTDPWFCSLSDNNKLFWLFLLDNCNHAGIWRVNWFVFGCYVKGFVYDPKLYEGRILELSVEKWYIPKFVEFQYGTLNPENRAHASVLSLLEKEGANKDLASPLLGPMDMVKAKAKDKIRLHKDNVNDFILPSWIDKKTWEAYLEIRKVKKAAATTHALKLIIMALERFRSEGMDPNMVLEKSIMSGWTGVFPLKVDFSKQPQKAYVGPKLPPGGTMVDGWGSGTEEEKRILEGK